jgi:hypothetical protein
VKPGVEISPWTDQKWVQGIAHIGAMSGHATAWDAGGHAWLDLVLSEDRYFIDATLRVNASPPLEQMALCLGDAVHNFRSAFDSLAWALCHVDGRVPSNPRAVYFPCAQKKSAWADAARALSSMPDVFLERIREVQPFVTGIETSALKLMVDLSNQDKHHGMITGRANPSGWALGIDTGGATGSRNGIENGLRIEFLHESNALEDGAPYARVETSVPVTLTHPREPVRLQYFVGVGEAEYPLPDVQLALIQLQQVLKYVCEGVWPTPERESA